MGMRFLATPSWSQLACSGGDWTLPGSTGCRARGFITAAGRRRGWPARGNSFTGGGGRTRLRGGRRELGRSGRDELREICGSRGDFGARRIAVEHYVTVPDRPD